MTVGAIDFACQTCYGLCGIIGSVEVLEYQMAEMGTPKYLELLDTRLIPDPANASGWGANPEGWHVRSVTGNRVVFCREVPAPKP